MMKLQPKFTRGLIVGTLVLGMVLPGHAQGPASEDAWAPIGVPAHGLKSALNITRAQDFDAAQQAYERCHWQQAFDLLVLLAEADHAQAARMALQMHRHGPTLYGQTFRLSPPQAERFARLHWRAQTAQAKAGH